MKKTQSSEMHEPSAPTIINLKMRNLAPFFSLKYLVGAATKLKPLQSSTAHKRAQIRGY